MTRAEKIEKALRNLLLRMERERKLGNVKGPVEECIDARAALAPSPEKAQEPCECGHPWAAHFGATKTCAVEDCPCLFGRAPPQPAPLPEEGAPDFLDRMIGAHNAEVLEKARPPSLGACPCGSGWRVDKCPCGGSGRQP